MKKVLIITYYWPPSGGSGVQRWLKFAKYLPKYGWQPIIYTPSNPESPATDSSLEGEVPAEAVVIKRPISEPYQAYKRLFGKGGGNKGGASVVNPINQSGKKSFIQKLSLWVRANLFIPDPRIFWVRPSVSYLTKYLEENPVDAIVSTGPPHSMHLIARELHRRTGIRWVADFRDPWTEIFYFKHLPMTFWAKKRHKHLERSVVREADAVVSVTRQMTSDFAALLEDDASKGKLHTICNGYDESDFITLGEVAPEKTFTLTHTGLFSADGNPLNLWRVLAELCCEDPGFKRDLKIRLIGNVDREVLDAIDSKGLTPNLENMGYLPHSQIPAIQQSAWGLLLPLRNEPESKAILAGKFFEYLAAGRPIVAFGPQDGEMARVLKETHSGVIFEWDETSTLKKQILDLYRIYCSGIRATDADRTAITKYSRRTLTSEMVKVLKK